MDKGLNLRDIEGMFDTAGEFVDIVKFGWGTSYVTNNLEKKIALYRHVRDAGRLRRHAVRGRLRARASSTSSRRGSSSTASRTSRSPTARSRSRASEKLELIADFARDFTVLSEVGSKDSEVVYAPYQWVEWIKEELEAGSWKVITEAPRGRHRRASSARTATCARA